MRNAVQRRNHKERAQPLERAKWGLLEKHKDYTLRAADHKSKQKRLKILREKARDRNPDEFSFKMMSTSSKGGRMIKERGNQALSMDVVKLLKTQDIGYVRTKLQSIKKERALVESEVLQQDAVSEKRGKIAYVETIQEQQTYTTDNVREDESESDEDDNVKVGREAKKKEKYADGQRRRLEHLRSVEEQLTTAEQELELQRAKMTSSVGGTNKNGVKFKVRQRKR